LARRWNMQRSNYFWTTCNGRRGLKAAEIPSRLLFHPGATYTT
jgi:hypothetical protein